MDKKLVDLAISAVKGKGYTGDHSTFSKEEVDDALRTEFGKLAGSINEFRKNRYDIYEIITEVADKTVPTKVESILGMVADIQVVPQGREVVFKKKVGRRRAKTFLTQVGLSGVYETFRLDTTKFPVRTHAIGGGATIDFERFLDGAEDMVDIMNIFAEGQVEAILGEVQKALRAALNAKGRPDANKVIASNFDATAMQRLINVVKNYGSGAAIFATEEFIMDMGPDAIVPGGANYQGVYSPDDIKEIHDRGLIKIFRGTPIIPLPQSYVDENNNETTLDPQMAYVLPTDGNKVVKIALEGETQIHDFTNRDNSMEIHTYRKVGVAILTHYDWGIYQNKGIPQTYHE
jgi:hypothetical protein